MSETAAEFLTERRDFLYVYATKSASGQGWDVVVRVDGTYSSKVGAEGAAEGIREWMANLSDVPREGRDWWYGPPWKRDALLPRRLEVDHPCRDL